jgi:secondary thiamine-phosphate synthase enzyme
VGVLEVQTDRRTQLVDVTERVREAIADRTAAVVTVFVPHTTAGIVLQARGAGALYVAEDVESALNRLVDEAGPWRHVEEGDRNPWSHVRAALTASSVTIPLEAGKLVLGENQAIFLCELDGPCSRRLIVSAY